jgi:hypothetical protein
VKVAIEKAKHPLRNVIHWTACEPFVENTMAVLIHRVRHVRTHKIGEKWPVHLGVSCWCGNTMTGTKKFTFLAAPPVDAIVCARCEEAAVRVGLPRSEEIVGAHVHTGGVIAVRDCCKAGEHQ